MLPDDAPFRLNVPPVTVVRPVYVLSAVRIVVPPPIWLTAPVPEIVPGNVTVSLRLKARAPLLATLPTMPPEAPPSPSCSVPALIVVPPL
jgi:hypothetical protein